jgi:hypothetical protein
MKVVRRRLVVRNGRRRIWIWRMVQLLHFVGITRDLLGADRPPGTPGRTVRYHRARPCTSAADLVWWLGTGLVAAVGHRSD